MFTSGCLGKQGVPPFPGEQEGLPAISACPTVPFDLEWKQGLVSHPGSDFAVQVAEVAALNCCWLSLLRALLSQQILAEPAWSALSRANTPDGSPGSEVGWVAAIAMPGVACSRAQ